MPPKKLNIIEPKKKPVKKPAKKKLPTKLRIVEKKIEPKKKPVKKKKKMPAKLNIVESKPKAKAKPKKLRIIAGGRYPALAKKMGLRPISEKDLAKTEADTKKRREEKERKAYPELNAITGLTQSEANEMEPMALFGLLPKELGKMVLNPSLRGGGVKLTDPATESIIRMMDKDQVHIDTMNESFHRDVIIGFRDYGNESGVKFEKKMKTKFNGLVKKAYLKSTGKKMNLGKTPLHRYSVIKLIKFALKKGVNHSVLEDIWEKYFFALEREFNNPTEATSGFGPTPEYDAWGFEISPDSPRHSTYGDEDYYGFLGN
tara:strand:+ start:23 stop:970 length:948 start_codon:yes stop_codon:yes gene_type:complete